jgi:acyl-coenzyme A thioesterase PaaI-like protein
MAEELSVQERFAPTSRCFGCGPSNLQGLRIRSLEDPENPAQLVCEWLPEEHHQAFVGVLNGGIIGALLDCHSNWTAGWHLMRRDRLAEPPVTVTGDFHIQLKRPTPLDQPVHLIAWAVMDRGVKVTVEAELHSGDLLTATCVGTFVTVKPGHPAALHARR